MTEFLNKLCSCRILVSNSTILEILTFYETIVFMLSIENRCSVSSGSQPGPSRFCYGEGSFLLPLSQGIKYISNVMDHCNRMVSLSFCFNCCKTHVREGRARRKPLKWMKIDLKLQQGRDQAKTC